MQEATPIVEINGRRLADYLQMAIETGNDLYTCIIVTLEGKERACMPITIGQIAANEKSLSIEIGGDTLNLVYYPNKYTSKLLIHTDEVYDGNQEVLGLHETVAQLIKSWDVLDDQGNPYPITPESLSQLGLPVVQMILRAIGQDSRPNS